MRPGLGPIHLSHVSWEFLDGGFNKLTSSGDNRWVVSAGNENSKMPVPLANSVASSTIRALLTFERLTVAMKCINHCKNTLDVLHLLSVHANFVPGGTSSRKSFLKMRPLENEHWRNKCPKCTQAAHACSVCASLPANNGSNLMLPTWGWNFMWSLDGRQGSFNHVNNTGGT